MALIKCIECNKEISDKALSCPHCGCPANYQNNSKITTQKLQFKKNHIKLSGFEYDFTEVFELIKKEHIKGIIKMRETVPGLSLMDAKNIADFIRDNQHVPQTFVLKNSPKIKPNANQEVEFKPPKTITCPACNQQVSNQAESCPHCGQPINTKPKCPICNSTNIRQIGGVERAGSVWMFGMFSSKINKSWTCNDCKAKW